ncbi:MAG TPA: trypsin-like peptidase domain-containing protein [Patescibacteria group bacterium]|nr:trypsin-like peptidase domain-containing protein [Patescibacteria group bacterium]
MAPRKFLFEDKAFGSKPQRYKKGSKFSCGMLAFIIISSLIFGFLGGAGAIYALSGNKNFSNSSLGLDLAKKTYKVTEESVIISASKKVSPSVVSIAVISNITDIFGRNATQNSQGSGFIITSDGLIMTNKHVASDLKAQYTVLTPDGSAYKAQVMAQDPLNDLAILKINASNLTPVNIGASDDLQVGQKVIAVGNALGFQNTVTSGIISAKGRTIQASDTAGSTQEELSGLLQTDAAINSGNSGGPLTNIDGQVIGINTAVANKGSAEGIGFAIPVNVARSAIESYRRNGKIIRPFIGIRYYSITKQYAAENKLPVENGALITSGQVGVPAIVVGSPAAKAGLQENDIITAINNEEVNQDHALSLLIQQYQPGDQIQITYLRDGKENKIKLKLVEYK